MAFASGNEQQKEAPRCTYIPTTLLCLKLPLAYGYTNGFDTIRAVYNTTKGHSLLLCFWLAHLKFSYDFRASKPKRRKRLSICLPPNGQSPLQGRATEWRGKSTKINEEWRMKSEEFDRICWKTQIQGQFTYSMKSEERRVKNEVAPLNPSKGWKNCNEMMRGWFKV